jgi:CubicO group peptidase (beta-lactamase class C family)
MMHILKYTICLFLFINILTGFSKAQNTDTIEISGKVQWKNKTITGYPRELKITSANKQEFACSIDSTGNYACRLPSGSYTLTPRLHYHWNGDDFIRIDEKYSSTSITISPEGSHSSPDLLLDTIGSPAQLPATGIARNFTTANARLLDEYINKQMAYFEIPGASLAVIKNGKLIYHQVYGVSNIETGIPVTAKTLFEAGSVTKPVFAFVVMRLVEKKVLNLDQPLYQLLSFDEVAQDERYKLITARLVLSHKTGLPNWAQRDSTGHFNLSFSPGTEFGYSGEGYEYLKRAIEHITHKSISQILNEELLAPLQLQGLWFKGSDYIKRNSAHGHKDLKPSDIRYIEKPMMAFSMFTEAKAFSNFMLALRNKKGLKSETYEKMFRIESTKENGIHWSLGFEIEDTPVGISYGHSGSTSSGFICNFRYFPKLDIGYVFLTNSDMGAYLSIPLLTQFIVTGKK